MGKIQKSAPQKILVRLPNWLGDLVMSLGFLKELRKTFPSAKIYAVARREHSEFASFIFKFEKIFELENKKISEIFKISQVLKKYEWDIYFSLPNSLSSALLGFLSGSKVKVGYRANMRDFLLTHLLKEPQNLHRVEKYANLLSPFSKKFQRKPEVKIEIPSGVWKEKGKPVKEILEKAKRTKLKIGLNPFSLAKSRTLSSRKTGKIVELLKENLDCTIFITGPKILDSKKVIFTERKLDLVQLALFISKLDVFVSVDSGLAHLSNALFIPTVVLFGAGDEKETSPYNRKFLKIVRADLPCSPCVKNECRFGKPICLEIIDEKKVLQSVVEFVQKETNLSEPSQDKS